MTVKDDIRQNLKALMAKRDVRNVDLARAVGVSKVAVTNWLNGSNSIDIEKVPRICEFLHVDIDEFLGQSANLKLTGDESRLIDLYRMASPAERTGIIAYARHAASRNVQGEGADQPSEDTMRTDHELESAHVSQGN